MDINNKMLANQVTDNFNGYKFYLYSQQSTWLAPTKINLYYGIWKRLAKTIDKDVLMEKKERFIKNSDGDVKFFGLAEIKEDALEKVINSGAGEADNILLFSTKPFSELYNQMHSLFEAKLFDVDFFNKQEKFSIFTSLLSSEERVLQFIYEEDVIFLQEVAK